MRRRPITLLRPASIVATASLAALLAAAPSAHGQTLPDVGAPLPPLRAPTLPATTPSLLQPVSPVLDSLQGVVAYAERAQALAAAERARVALDPQGAAMLRHEFIAYGPDAQALSAARAVGFEVLREARYDSLDVAVTVLRDTRGRRPARAIRALRAAMPGVETAFHHLYLPAASSAPDASTATPPIPRLDARPGTTPLRVGLIDGGVDDTVPALSRVRIERHGCDGVARPQAHGTAVAERLIGGLAGTLFAADLWCGDRVGRGTLGVIDALDWMARERVPVVNISLVGPDNPLLRRAVARMRERGHVVVAAVGNDGPAAPPLFPASYPEVIGVAAVDARLRVLPESASGPQVDFCAPGVIDAQHRGTSFAAPVVARVAAILVASSSTASIETLQAQLRAVARDLGKPGRDTRCGDGYLSGL